tara:strand:- start:286 stop:537 length:252 start_codon:yes stop_codon:yes gene_type:complete
MIYTRFGVKVKIKSFDWINHIAICETIKDMTDVGCWEGGKICKRHIAELKADGGIKEIDVAIENADSHHESDKELDLIARGAI